MLLPEIVKEIWHGTSPEYPVKFNHHNFDDYILHMEKAGIFTVDKDRDGKLWVSRTHLGQSIVDNYMIKAGIDYLLKAKEWVKAPYATHKPPLYPA